MKTTDQIAEAVELLKTILSFPSTVTTQQIERMIEKLESRAAHASEKKRCKCGNAIYTGDVCEQCLRESRTARASEP